MVNKTTEKRKYAQLRRWINQTKQNKNRSDEEMRKEVDEIINVGILCNGQSALLYIFVHSVWMLCDCAIE